MNLRATALLISLIGSVSLACDKQPAPAQERPAKPAEPSAAVDPKPAEEVKPTTPAPTPDPEPPSADPSPAAEPSDAAGAAVVEPEGGLPPGKHRCSFTDTSGKYNRVCTVTRDAAGHLTVSAPGTELNPDNGFDGTLEGGPDSYRFSGKIAGFDDCVGAFEATVSAEKDAYVATAKLDSGCPITIRITRPKPK